MEVAEDMGVLAIALGYATSRQVRDARREQERRGRTEGRRTFLAEILFEAGVLDRDQLHELVERGRARRELGPHVTARFGEIAASKRYVAEADLAAALEQQRDEDASGGPRRLIGEILLESGWLSPWELEDVVATLADLASGSSRTGDTPSDAIPVGPGLIDGFTPRRSPRSLAGVRTKPCLTREVMGQVPTTTDRALLGDVLDTAFEVEADVVLVMAGANLRGIVPVWEVCQLDRATPVRDVMSSTFTTVSGAVSVAETTRILRDRDLQCVVVVSDGRFAGVVTSRELRRAGVRPSELEEFAVPFEELGVGD